MDWIFHVPRALANELELDGLATLYEPPQVKVSGAAMVDLGHAATVALVVLGVGADIVAVTGVRPPLAAIAQKIASWTYRSKGGGRKFALLAIGPKGQARLDLDEQPGSDAVVKLLETVYGEEEGA